MFVSQSTEIAKPVQEVFDKVRDLHSWPEWSPWLIADPEAEVTNQEDGYAWDGDICGSGSMKVIGANPGESIDFDLSFFKPFKSCAKVKMIFKEGGGGIKVTWTMDSSLPFFLFWMKKSMEGFIGMD
ncbi:SRPBCC family protein, partial [Akkermansiaceae bacterium]|nr:SRPBCC family protein [Akkermansiaceae bacterium]